MSPTNRQKPYKALTHVNLPFIEKRYAPGDMIEIDDLKAAQQSDEDVQALIDSGALGEEGDDIHPDNIIPDPSMPTIQSVIAQAQAMVEHLKGKGEKVPAELKAVAEMDYSHVTTSDKGVSSERGSN